jgi:hypothetical protein
LDHFQGIRTALASSPARRARQGFDVWDLDTGPWWKLFTDWQSLDRVKRAILAVVWEMPKPLFFVPPYMEMATALEPFLLPHDSGAWLVNRQRSPEDFYGVELDEGNWVVYSAAQPSNVRMPNTFKTTPSVLINFMREQGITVLIDAFYDDREWRVALAEPAP